MRARDLRSCCCTCREFCQVISSFEELDRFRIECLNSIKITSFGSHGNNVGQFDHPRGVCIDPTSGNIFVCDSLNDRVQIFSPKGFPISTFGGKDSQLYYPTQIHISNSTVFILDHQCRRIQVFTMKLTFTKSIMMEKQCRTFTCLENGNIVIVYDSNEIEIPDQKIKFLPDTDRGMISAIASNCLDQIFIAYKNRIRILMGQETIDDFECDIGPAVSISDIYIDGRNRLFLLNTWHEHITIVNSAGRCLGRIKPVIEGGISIVSTMCGLNGRIILSDIFHHRISCFHVY